MTNTIYTKTYDAPAINHKEILRYAGVRENTPEIDDLISSCLQEIEGKLTYNVCYREFPLNVTDNNIDLGFMTSTSLSLRRNLVNCKSIIIFAATIGIGIDRLITRYSRISPSKAFMFQTIGAERIESLCDTFNDEIEVLKHEENASLRPRFSPGYGDFPLEAQREIFKVLDCPRKIGLTLNDSMLMSPSKSVTAIIGVSDEPCGVKHKENCEICNKFDCIYRK